MKKIILPLITLIFISCSVEHLDKEQDLFTESVIEADPSTSVDIIQLENGCKEFITFYDKSPFNGVFDNGEIFIKKLLDCNSNIVITQIKEGNCVKLITFDDNLIKNNLLDPEEELIGENLICNGLNGNDGESGIDGSSSMITSEIIEHGEICEHGGVKFIIMNDKDGDGVFEDVREEIVCTLKCPVHEEETCLEIENTTHCKLGLDYSVWMSGTHYQNVSLEWIPTDNDKVLLKGLAVNKDDPTHFIEVIVTFSGKTTITPENSPKEHRCYDIDSNDWVYFTKLEGVIIDKKTLTSYTLYIKDVVPQLGVNANSTENKDNQYGFSSWFYYGISRKSGDFNFNLNNCN